MPRFEVTIHTHTVHIVDIEAPDADLARAEAHAAVTDEEYMPEDGCTVHDIVEDVALDDGDIDVYELKDESNYA